MAYSKGVIRTFRTFWKTRQPFPDADTAHLPGTAGEYFMRISLMTHIPDNFIIGRIKDFMQGDG